MLFSWSSIAIVVIGIVGGFVSTSQTRRNLTLRNGGVLKQTSLAVGLAASVTALFCGLILYFANHPPLNDVRAFWMTYDGIGMATMLAMVFHAKPRPGWLKVAAIAYVIPAGLILPIYHFSQISVWFGVGLVGTWVAIFVWRRRTKQTWGVWWAGW